MLIDGGETTASSTMYTVLKNRGIDYIDTLVITLAHSDQAGGVAGALNYTKVGDFGETSFLYTGDMEETAEKDLVDADSYLEADMLKTGRHGSRTSTCYQFLREVAPTYAVISCGDGNSFGHPHDETMSKLRDAGVTVFRTDMQGNHHLCLRRHYALLDDRQERLSGRHQPDPRRRFGPKLSRYGWHLHWQS